jgi:hypothetical protein
MRLRQLLFLVITVGLISTQSFAAQCTKDFPYYFVTGATGVLGLYIGTSGYWWYPCSVSQQINGVTTETCKTALASVLVAKINKKPLTFSWSGACEELDPATATGTISDKGFNWLGIRIKGSDSLI